MPGAPCGPARTPRRIRRGPGVGGRLAAMAESAPARVRVLLARTRGRVRDGGAPAGAGLRGAGLGGRGPQLAWVNADLPAQPQSSAFPLSVSSASGHSPSATRLRRETSRRFVSCSWICYRPYTFSSRPKRARFQAGEGARIGNSGFPSLPVNLPGASGTPGLCLSATSSFSG